MRRYTKIIILIVFSWVCPMGVCDTIEKKIDASLGGFTQDNSDTGWLTDDVRPLVIERLLARLTSASNVEEQTEIEMKLVTAGHLETIERLAKKMKAGDDARALEFSATEASIPALMDVVKTGSSLVPGFGSGSDVFTPSVRIQAASIVFEMIRSKDVFPAATKHWFADLDPLDDSEKGLENLSRLEKWWKGNQGAIEARTYSEATWLPSAAVGRGASNKRPSIRGKDDKRHESTVSNDSRTGHRSEEPGEGTQNRIGGGTVAVFITVAGMMAFLIWLFLKTRSRQQEPP